jgi:hypothetical protein
MGRMLLLVERVLNRLVDGKVLERYMLVFWDMLRRTPQDKTLRSRYITICEGLYGNNIVNSIPFEFVQL